MTCANREVLLCDGQRESLALKLFLLNYGMCPQAHFFGCEGSRWTNMAALLH